MIPYILSQILVGILLSLFGWACWAGVKTSSAGFRLMGRTVAVIMWAVAVLSIVGAPSGYRHQLESEKQLSAAFAAMTPDQHLAKAKELWASETVFTETTQAEITRQLKPVPLDLKANFIEQMNEAIHLHNQRIQERIESLAAARQAVNDAEASCPTFMDAPIGNKKCPDLVTAKANLKQLEDEK